MRLIDADALHAYFKAIPYADLTGDELNWVLRIYDAIDNTPTIDAEPVRHGRWIDMQEDDATEGMWRCSACGSDRYFDIFTPGEAGCYYCPNCGAKMHAEEVIDR